jgi:hypothetical protein
LLADKFCALLIELALLLVLFDTLLLQPCLVQLLLELAYTMLLGCGRFGDFMDVHTDIYGCRD